MRQGYKLVCCTSDYSLSLRNIFHRVCIDSAFQIASAWVCPKRFHLIIQRPYFKFLHLVTPHFCTDRRFERNNQYSALYVISIMTWWCIDMLAQRVEFRESTFTFFLVCRLKCFLNKSEIKLIMEKVSWESVFNNSLTRGVFNKSWFYTLSSYSFNVDDHLHTLPSQFRLTKKQYNKIFLFVD